MQDESGLPTGRWIKSSDWSVDLRGLQVKRLSWDINVCLSLHSALKKHEIIVFNQLCILLITSQGHIQCDLSYYWWGQAGRWISSEYIYVNVGSVGWTRLIELCSSYHRMIEYALIFLRLSLNLTSMWMLRAWHYSLPLKLRLQELLRPQQRGLRFPGWTAFHKQIYRGKKRK